MVLKYHANTTEGAEGAYDKREVIKLQTFDSNEKDSMNEKSNTIVPVVEDYALADESSADLIMEKIRNDKIPILELSDAEFYFAYQISRRCNEQEYLELLEAFKVRANPEIFRIGWIYCQFNPNENRATELFSLSSEWMRVHQAEEFKKTLISRTGLPWKDIYTKAVDVMKLWMSPFPEFCKKYNVRKGTLFFDQLEMTYFSRSNLNEFLNNRDRFAELIRTSRVEFLKPAISNYLLRVEIEVIPDVIYNAIVSRYETEGDGRSLGISPDLLKKIRQQSSKDVVEADSEVEKEHCLSIEAKVLNHISQKLNGAVPSIKDYALADKSSVAPIVEVIRNDKVHFLELSESDFYLVYQLSLICNELEFLELLDAFKKRANLEIFQIGWIYCQTSPDENRAAELFSLSWEWMKDNEEKAYRKALVSRTGLPWSDIYLRSVDIMRIGRQSLEEFCKKFSVMIDTPFYERLMMAYFARCNLPEIMDNEKRFIDLILTAQVEFLKPAIANYISRVQVDDIPVSIFEAIASRLEAEHSSEALGLSPNIIHKVRQNQFNGSLEEILTSDTNKKKFYQSISGQIRKIERLKDEIFSIDFGKYTVVDCVRWGEIAYAFQEKTYMQLAELWEKKDYQNNFWPGVNEKELVAAHDIVLGIKQSNAILLNFSGFDVLYTKDLLANGR